MLESRAGGALFDAWEEASNLLDRANLEVERYRMIATNLISKAESKGNFIRISASFLEETSMRQAEKLKDYAVSRFNGKKEKETLDEQEKASVEIASKKKETAIDRKEDLEGGTELKKEDLNKYGNKIAVGTENTNMESEDEKDETNMAQPEQRPIMPVQPIRMPKRRALQDKFECEEEMDREMTDGF